MNPNLPILALACDFDETLAHEGQVELSAMEALLRFKTSCKSLILITGRLLDDLQETCPETDIFDLIIAENGALSFAPKTGRISELAGAAPPALVEALRQKGVQPLSAGHSIIGTVLEHYQVVRETIAELQLPLEVILNRSSIMILPAGVDKGSGLKWALEELGVAPQHVVGIGDGENDHAFLSLCGSYVAVANAIPALREAADVVTEGSCGRGVTEVIDRILKNANDKSADDFCSTGTAR